MPGPRKNLTPLDMQMLGLAYNQGGVINFLGQQPEVTAPVRAQSHADSPPTQLAYITDAEKDLLVDANIHGSMDGQPNQGPAGLESLDDWYTGGVGGSTQNEADPPPPSGGNAADKGIQRWVPQPHVNPPPPDPDPDPPEDTTYQPGGHHPDTTTTTTTTRPWKEDEITGDYVSGTVIPDTSSSIGSIGQMTHDYQHPDTDTGSGITNIWNKWGHGDPLDDYVGDKNWVTPKGQHKLRSQFDRLAAKYGKSFYDPETGEMSEQAKVLANYLSGVAVERGGGLGAYDDTYGGGKWGVDEYGNPIDPESDAYKEAEKYRQEVLDIMSHKVDPDVYTYRLKNWNFDKLRYGLSPDQFYNFNQQLMAADPTPGNEAYKAARPWSSGSGINALTRFIPGIGTAQTFLGGLLPEQSQWGDWEANQQIFKDTSMPVYGEGDGGGVMNAWQGNNPYQDIDLGIPDPEDEEEDEDDVVDLTPTPTPYPVYGEGVAGLDWSQFGPHFGPQYPGHYSHWGSGYANGGIARLLNQYG
jgi:hypothetical protein